MQNYEFFFDIVMLQWFVWGEWSSANLYGGFFNGDYHFYILWEYCEYVKINSSVIFLDVLHFLRALHFNAYYHYLLLNEPQRVDWWYFCSFAEIKNPDKSQSKIWELFKKQLRTSKQLSVDIPAERNFFTILYFNSTKSRWKLWEVYASRNMNLILCKSFYETFIKYSLFTFILLIL